MSVEWCVPPPEGCARCGARLGPRRRKWCSGECMELAYADHRWSHAREEAMRRAGRRCVRCQAPAEEVDHIIERRGLALTEWTCLHHQTNLRALCHGCHVTRHQWDSPQASLGTMR